MEKLYPTPHINAKPGDFARTVLLPGDPLRAKYIADNYLKDAKLVNNVRGVNGYTGYYEGKKVSVMGSGMGMPSIGIYSYELFNFFAVDNIIRVGSAGGMSEKTNVGDVVVGMGACTDSNYASNFGIPGTFAPIADYDLMNYCVETGREMGLRLKVGNLLSTDVFYKDELYEDGLGLTNLERWAKMGVLAEEMEAAALYMNAARAGKRALCVCTISDNMLTDEHMTSDERLDSFNDMIELALKTSLKL